MSHNQFESNWAVQFRNYYCNYIDSNLFDLYFLLSKKHRKKKVRQKSSSKSDDESEGKVLPIDKNNAHSEFLVWLVSQTMCCNTLWA